MLLRRPPAVPAPAAALARILACISATRFLSSRVFSSACLDFNSSSLAVLRCFSSMSLLMIPCLISFAFFSAASSASCLALVSYGFSPSVRNKSRTRLACCCLCSNFSKTSTNLAYRSGSTSAFLSILINILDALPPSNLNWFEMYSRYLSRLNLYFLVVVLSFRIKLRPLDEINARLPSYLSVFIRPGAE